MKFKKLFTIFVVIVFLFFLLSLSCIYDKSELIYGVTFSQKQAKDLGLDWQETYLAILDDLGVRKLRISAYWDEVEKEDDKFDWEELDWMIAQAEAREVEIILALGTRLPRWPECHYPDWAYKLEGARKEAQLFQYIREVVGRYKNRSSIEAWQVENEPFLSNFGECPDLDKNLLDAEIALVKKLDNRPIVITDSGELSLWVPAAKRADIFGTTMYRDTYSQHLKSYIHYPITPGFFRFKKNITRLFAKPEKWIIVELQGEPWGPIPFQNLTEKERARTMDHKKFKEIIEFSSKTSFKEIYFWGVEWWYWEKTTRNNPALWDEAKKLYQ